MFGPASLAPNFPNINQTVDLPNAEALYATLVGRINYVSGSSWVNATTHQYQIEGMGTNKEGQTVGGLYFQDSWHTTSHLALNYGLRWELTGAVHNNNGLGRVLPSPICMVRRQDCFSRAH